MPNQFFRSLSVLGSTLLALSANAAVDGDFARTNEIVHLPLAIKVSAQGKIDADTAKWKIEKDPEGTELFTAKSGDETRVAAMKGDDGVLESFTSYVMKKKAENSSTVFFTKGKLSAFTSCEASADKDSIGRICVTATPKLCQNLKKGDGIDPATLKEIDLFEMRALAAILTLRGSDHQLENVVKSGNRLGLKSALQTTKGQIYALVKQITKETQKKSDGRDPATEAAESQLAKSVLEKSLPRLKDACVVTKF